MNESKLQRISASAQELKPDLLAFAQQLVQTPSLPGEEAEIARLVSTEMMKLGYDDVSVDRVGNIIGHIAGDTGRRRLFNGHMDHVDIGAIGDWRYPPFSGQIVAGELWGRGSVDMKGGLAAMIYAGGLLKRVALRPPGDLLVAAVVLEEVGGQGTKNLIHDNSPEWAVVGEPSGNDLRRGHRGRFEFEVMVRGKAGHASMPEIAINPNYIIACFLNRLHDYHGPESADFGRASVAPTLYRTDTQAANIIPGNARISLDYRCIPGESLGMAKESMNAIIQECIPPGASATLRLAQRRMRSYTAVDCSHEDFTPSFAIAIDDPLLAKAQADLQQALHHPVPIDIWRFATDGGRMAEAGILTFGFGPGDERLPHTTEERLAIVQLEEALVGYAVLAMIH